MVGELRTARRPRALWRGLFSAETEIHRPARRAFHFRFVFELPLRRVARSDGNDWPLSRARSGRIDRARAAKSRIVQDLAPGLARWIDNLLFNHHHFLVAERSRLRQNLCRFDSSAHCWFAAIQRDADLDVFP